MIYSFTQNKSTHYAALAALLMGLFTSCGKTDTEAPGVCSDPGCASCVLADEIDAMAGTTVVLTDAFCDNEELSEVRWDVHNAADHAHEDGEVEEEFVLHSGIAWEVLETVVLSGSSEEHTLSLAIPQDVRGIWDVVVSVVDAAGNTGSDIVTQLHIENDYIPAFTVSSVNGVDPAEWTEEAVWAPGATVEIAGSVSDSDGVVSAHIAFVRESDEAMIWEVDLEATGDAELAFNINQTVPADAATGEYHLELTATDGLGNEVETGFHVEVE